MFKNDSIRWLALELFKQLDRLDVDDRREQLDKLIDMLSSRRSKLIDNSKNISRYEIKQVRGHYEVFRDGKFYCSADSYSEAEKEISED